MRFWTQIIVIGALTLTEIAILNTVYAYNKYQWHDIAFQQDMETDANTKKRILDINKEFAEEDSLGLTANNLFGMFLKFGDGFIPIEELKVKMIEKLDLAQKRKEELRKKSQNAAYMAIRNRVVAIWKKWLKIVNKDIKNLKAGKIEIEELRTKYRKSAENWVQSANRDLGVERRLLSDLMAEPASSN